MWYRVHLLTSGEDGWPWSANVPYVSSVPGVKVRFRPKSTGSATLQVRMVGLKQRMFLRWIWLSLISAFTCVIQSSPSDLRWGWLALISEFTCVIQSSPSDLRWGWLALISEFTCVIQSSPSDLRWGWLALISECSSGEQCCRCKGPAPAKKYRLRPVPAPQHCRWGWLPLISECFSGKDGWP